MEQLYFETPNGLVPIEQEIASKYNLAKGTLSPFSRNRIVGENGEYAIGKIENEELEKYEESDDGIPELENGLLMSTSEMIDFSQGTDASRENEENTNTGDNTFF